MMIIIPAIKLLFFEIFLLFIVFDKQKPKDININEIIKVDIVVKAILSPEMLAPIPKPKLFKARARDKARDSLKSILPDLSLSATSGFSNIKVGEESFSLLCEVRIFFSLK